MGGGCKKELAFREPVGWNRMCHPPNHVTSAVRPSSSFSLNYKHAQSCQICILFYSIHSCRGMRSFPGFLSQSKKVCVCVPCRTHLSRVYSCLVPSGDWDRIQQLIMRTSLCVEATGCYCWRNSVTHFIFSPLVAAKSHTRFEIQSLQSCFFFFLPHHKLFN